MATKIFPGGRINSFTLAAPAGTSSYGQELDITAPDSQHYAFMVSTVGSGGQNMVNECGVYYCCGNGNITGQTARFSTIVNASTVAVSVDEDNHRFRVRNNTTQYPHDIVVTVTVLLDEANALSFTVNTPSGPGG